MTFTLAHLSDTHLGPVPLGNAFRNFALKRIVGTASWMLKRRRLHVTAIAESIRQDILALAPSHVAFTGDMMNIAALSEYPAAARWIAQLGAPENVSFVPGNHDCYVPVPYQSGLAHLERYMAGDMRLDLPLVALGGTTAFPFVRLRRNVAVIGVSTGLPQRIDRACGEVGKIQLDALEQLLPELRQRGYFRLILIHHPPLAHQAPARRGLTDSAALTRILAEHGAELVLHGHNHTRTLFYLESQHGAVPVFGAPSASMRPLNHHHAAGWTLLSIERNKGAWMIEAQDRDWNDKEGQVAAGKSYTVTRDKQAL